MEGKDNSAAKHKNEEVTIEEGISNIRISTPLEINPYVWHETITVIDLSGQNIVTLDDKMVLPTNLMHLNLSHNKLVEVPDVILMLPKLIILNLSHNAIDYFDHCPEFCHTLEHLDMSYNQLAGPPYWIWSEAPQKLVQLNLSNNSNITKSFVNGYFEEILQYNTLVQKVDIQNCSLGKFTNLIASFSKAKSLCLGAEDYSGTANFLIEVPCQGLDKCCDLISLKVCNTNIYSISPRIEMYKNLVEINLAQNDLCGIPNEFCNLENLEICILSYNKILYLPDEIYKMRKLRQLYLDSNKICMLPDTLKKLLSLITLDLYDNNLNEVPNYENLEEIDFALNYSEEPTDNLYLDKKEKLRMLHENRHNGRKPMIIKADNDCSEGSSCLEEDDDELYEIFYNGKKVDSPNVTPPSSPEDWDSDDYWVPGHLNPLPPAPSSWLCFVKQKMKEGNLCPMDAHPISIAEKLKYQRLINPPVFYESDGQFDDYSSDNA
uniref:Leucine rich repeat protein n=1 Tax=Biston betularia TaxID=82595 RepID=A0A173FDC5_BISBE|nr:leucine rich repeat protein [Biston betularia]